MNKSVTKGRKILYISKATVVYVLCGDGISKVTVVSLYCVVMVYLRSLWSLYCEVMVYLMPLICTVLMANIYKPYP